MVNRLKVEKNDKILEPCAGDGVFVDKIISTKKKMGVEIDALDLNPEATKILSAKYKANKSIKVQNLDTLFDLSLDKYSNDGGYFDKVIGNPPYGAWQEYLKREELKKKYGGYVRETYTLFLRRCISLLKPNGRLVFIIPDTFLALHLHKGLRQFLLENTVIEEILLIPSKFFPGVNFGYSNLCIISLVKTTPSPTTSFELVTVTKDVNTLYELAKNDYSTVEKKVSTLQAGILKNLAYSFYLGGTEEINTLVNNSKIKLGDIADCVTGFYSGDNKKFIKVLEKDDDDKSGFEVISSSEIQYLPSKAAQALNGLTKKKYIPIYKGGKGTIDKKLDRFVAWDQETVRHYKSDSKARFQNASYYFKSGIGAPKVKSKSFNAFRIQNQIFDQSVVGIFPKDKKHFNLILTFLNSETCTKIINTINHTANSSSNYLKKLPFIVSNKTIEKANEIVKDYDKTKNMESFLTEVNKLYREIYKF